MSDVNAIAAGICSFVKGHFVVPEVEVLPATPFEQLGLDSFSLIELVLFLERNYGIVLPDHELTRDNMVSALTLAGCAIKHLPSAG
jgi:acyl carrier protein